MSISLVGLAIIAEIKRVVAIVKIKFRYFLPPPLIVNNDIVVSLTSYGRRVTKSVPYVIYQLMYQTIRPSAIVLWLSEKEFNNDNLPTSLKKLQKVGVTIRFCKDIKSYKKLIYSLIEYKDKIIITVDDDVLYDNKLIETLYNSYKQNQCVCAINYHQPIIRNGKEEFIPYNDWPDKRINELPCVAVGAGGILYPPNCFDEEVLNQDVFLNLCPNADDIWFWAMEIRQGLPVYCVDNKIKNLPLDWFYQHLHKGAALQHINVDQNANDVKIRNVFDHYNLWSLVDKK